MQQLVIENGALRRLQVNEHGLEEFGAFYIAHQDYLRAVVADFDSWASFSRIKSQLGRTGLPEPATYLKSAGRG